MKNLRRRNRRKNPNVSLAVAMFVPMLLMAVSAFTYAQWSMQLTCLTTLNGVREDIEIVNWIINCTNTQDANSNGVIFGDELVVTEITDPLTGQLTCLEIAADPIFPGWILHVIIEIHNRPSPDSVPVNVSYEISCYNETTLQWEKIAEEDLQTQFNITYVDGFYLDPDLTSPMPADYVVNPDQYFYKSEYITLDEDAPPTLQGQSLEFRVEIYAEWTGV